MDKCQWANYRCEEWGTQTLEDGRSFCADHYEQVMKIRGDFQKAFKKAGLKVRE